MKLNIMQQLAAFKTMLGIKLFTFTVDFETDTVIAVCKAKPEVRYILNDDGTDILQTDLKCGIEILDMVTVQQNKEFMDEVSKAKLAKKPNVFNI